MGRTGVNNMRVAFDVHGVLDSFKYFRDLLKTHHQNGHEVYIISGQLLDEQMKEFIETHDLPFNHYLSVTGELQDRGVDIDWSSGLPFVDADIWNPVKSEICVREKIDIIYDDSSVYKETFNEIDTLFIHVINTNRKQYKTRG